VASPLDGRAPLKSPRRRADVEGLAKALGPPLNTSVQRFRDDRKSGSERRRSERVDLLVRVDYKTVDELFSEFARNINEGGMFVETDAPA